MFGVYYYGFILLFFMFFCFKDNGVIPMEEPSDDLVNLSNENRSLSKDGEEHKDLVICESKISYIL